MNTVEISINQETMEYNGVTYELDYAIKKDKKAIFNEAMNSHGDTFETEYDKESFRPDKVSVYVSETGELLYGMIIYIIDYKDHKNGRYACGNYYPFCKLSTGKNFMEPHPYQASICW